MTPQQIAQNFQSVQQFTTLIWNRLTRIDQRLTGLEARDALRAAGRSPTMPLEFRAQYGEDMMAWQLAGRKLDGFFIEVGAFNGYDFSVTYALEAMGWRGLLIEAIPERAAECAARRKNSRVVHAALGPAGVSGTTTFNRVEDDFGGMLSGREMTAELRQTLSENRYGHRVIEVPVTSMDALLEGHSGGIDIAVIDVEGGELDLLRGFDLNKHRPSVLFIEDNVAGGAPELEAYMATQPYRMCGWISVNRLYVRQDDEAALSAAQQM
jgi:FkbM family methyltransferase